MLTINELSSWLQMIDSPAFCVKDSKLIAVNTAAEKLGICVGTDVGELITEHRAAYEGHQNGELQLTLLINGVPRPACIQRTAAYDIFRLRSHHEDRVLQALALAAVQLRSPLSNAMSAADALQQSQQTDPEIGPLNKNLFRLMRIVSNMADGGWGCDAPMQTINLSALINEIAEKAQTLCEGSGIRLAYTGMDTPVFSLANSEKLERAVYNLLANAFKFSPAGSTVSASLTKSGGRVLFAVTNSLDEAPPSGGFWQQHLREPAIEDPRQGLGLGMSMISTAANLHGGTVLVDRPTDDSVRVTLTIPIKNDESGTIRSPIMHISDYAGGWDKGLIELSDVIPTDNYKNK